MQMPVISGTLITRDLHVNFLFSRSIVRILDAITIVSSARPSTTVLSRRLMRKPWPKRGHIRAISLRNAYANGRLSERPRRFAGGSKKSSRREHRRLLSFCRTRKISSRYVCSHKNVWDRSEKLMRIRWPDAPAWQRSSVACDVIIAGERDTMTPQGMTPQGSTPGDAADAADTADGASDVTVAEVRFEHHRDSFGIGEAQPRLSWIVD